jgi:hypothetical protein
LPPGVEAFLVGSVDGHKSFKLWVPSLNQIKVSHHVRFFPTEFPELNPLSNRSAVENWLVDLFDEGASDNVTAKPETKPDLPAASEGIPHDPEEHIAEPPPPAEDIEELPSLPINPKPQRLRLRPLLRHCAAKNL